MLGSIGTNLWVSALVVVVFFTLVLGISVLRGRHDTVDTAWGLAFAVVAIASLLLSAGQRDLGASIAWRRYLITGLTIVWGVRLAVHLHLRNGPRGEDPRYQRILASAKGSPLAHAVRKVYLPQAAFAWVISLPLQVGQYSTGRDPVSLTLY
ncbi:MAG: DUF1295 domain-containing protein, partial [Sciscionella sp.]